MEESDITSVSEEILKQAEDYIKELLKNKKLSTVVKAQLEIQSYFLTILTLDHTRIGRIYPWAMKQQESQRKRQSAIEKLAWIVIPILVTGFFLFIGQFIYFWIVVVPKLVTP